MKPPSTANNAPLRAAPAPHAGPSGPAAAGDLAELADPPKERWRVVKHNPSRTVYVGRWGGREVFLKHFHTRSPVRWLVQMIRGSDAKREANFAATLVRCGVAVPTVLACGGKGRLSWLATAAVEGEPADKWHERQAALGPQGARAVRQATIALAEMVARMHQAGVIHGDLHCGNILIRTAEGSVQPVLMDLHRMRRRRPLSQRTRAANLAQLCHDRAPFTTRSERLRFLAHYLATAGAPGTLRSWHRWVDRFARLHARRQYAQRDRRILGRGRYFATIRLPGGWRGHVVLATKNPLPGSDAATMTFTADDWRRVLARPEALFTGDVEQIKDSPSSQVVRRRLTVGGRSVEVFVKRARRKYLRRLFIDCCRRARAVRAFKLGHKLLNRRMATALPLAALERRAGPVLVDSILITEAVQAPSLCDFLNSAAGRGGQAALHLPPAERLHLARQIPWRIGRLVQRLHDHGLAHRDLKAGNLLLRWSRGQEPQLVLLDLDGLGLRRFPTVRDRFRGLMRLNVSLMDCPAVNQAGRLRLLMGYLRRPGCGKVDYKPYWRALEDWSARSLRHRLHSRRKLQKTIRRPAS